MKWLLQLIFHALFDWLLKRVKAWQKERELKRELEAKQQEALDKYLATKGQPRTEETKKAEQDFLNS